MGAKGETGKTLLTEFCIWFYILGIFHFRSFLVPLKKRVPVCVLCRSMENASAMFDFVFSPVLFESTASLNISYSYRHNK